ncbi:hypothetical protein HZ994_16935 [Akkermansiaceae bacterium]|nr:hypothetical protein HZ994_16935 [Akkermansiaceae bacterium]
MRNFLSPNAESLRAPTAGEIARTACVALVGFGIYGLTVGWWRAPMMGLFVAVKMPLLIALTLGCNGLLNGLLGLLMGSGLGFRQSLHALLSAFAISGLILGSVAPVTFFLALNVPAAESTEAATAHSAYLLIHVFLIAVAGLAGVVRLRGLLEGYTASPAIARSTLGAWIAGNAFLGMQFSWILRPFFGSPRLEVAFLRENPMAGSFLEAVWGSLERILGGMGFGAAILAAVCAGIAAIVIFQIRNEHRKTKP